MDHSGPNNHHNKKVPKETMMIDTDPFLDAVYIGVFVMMMMMMMMLLNI